MRLHHKSVPLLTLVLIAIAGLAGPQHFFGEDESHGGTTTQDPSAKTQYRAVRFIEDPSTHLRWILMKDPSHPGWPARLEPFANNFLARGSVDRAILLQSHRVPVIHAGDALTITQHTAVSEVRLEAIALGPAAVGDSVRVRLKTSGHLLSVVVDGAGRATLLSGRTEVRW